MRSETEHLWMRTREKVQFVDITGRVEETVTRTGVREGFAFIRPVDDACSVFLDGAKKSPSESLLERQLGGREVMVSIAGGRLDLRNRGQIFYGEFDGRRPKRVVVKLIGA